MACIMEIRHPDFERIYNAFLMRYIKLGQTKEEGEKAYYAWLNKYGLDDTKPYGAKERFAWINPHFKLIREDTDAKYYKVEALFPLTSMNGRIYTDNELRQAVRTMIGKTSNINHTDEGLDGVDIVDAEYEDDAVELLVRVDKEATCSLGNICDLIDNGDFVNVSIEANAVRGVEDTPAGQLLRGIVFTGLGWLTKNVLPGVPLTRIMSVEKFVESIEKTETQRGEYEMPTQEENQAADAQEEVSAPADTPTADAENLEVTAEQEPSPPQGEPTGDVDFQADLEALKEAVAGLIKTVGEIQSELQEIKNKLTVEQPPEPPAEVTSKEWFTQQKQKYIQKGATEKEAVKLAYMDVIREVFS